MAKKKAIDPKTLKFNELRTLCKARGFTGKSPKRDELLTWLDAQPAEQPKAKRAYRAVGRSEVAARRKNTVDAVRAVLNGADCPEGGMTVSQVHRAVEATVPDSRWSDTFTAVQAVGIMVSDGTGRDRFRGALPAEDEAEAPAAVDTTSNDEPVVDTTDDTDPDLAPSAEDDSDLTEAELANRAALAELELAQAAA